MHRLVELVKWMWLSVMPEFCLGCGRRYEVLCERCWLKVEFVYEQRCAVCGEASIGGLTHPKCGNGFGLDGLWCVAVYKGPVKTLIHQLKYAHAISLRVLIEQLFCRYAEHEAILLPPAVLVPVPLHARSQLRRGFNQSEVVAECLSEVLRYPVVTGVVERTKKTLSQTKLDKEQRRLNVAGCFGLGDPEKEMKKAVRGRTFIVVDDVFTSGATMGEVAKALKEAGAGQVFGFALARD